MIYMDYQEDDRVIISATAEELSGGYDGKRSCGAGRHTGCNPEGIMAKYAGREATILSIFEDRERHHAKLDGCGNWDWCFCQLTPIGKTRVLD
jgi:hypothetical protein